MKDARKRTDLELQSLKIKLEKLEREKSTVDQQVDQCKREISNQSSQLSDIQHMELKKIPHEQATLSQFVQIHIYENVREHKRRAEELQEQIMVLTENNRHTSSALEKLQREHEHLKQTNNDSAESERRMKEELQQRLQKAEEQLREQLTQWEQYRHRNENLDTLQTNLNTLTSQVHQYESQTQFLEKQLNMEQEAKKVLRDEAKSLDQQLQLLQKDKIYLSKENESLNLQVEQLRQEQQQQSTLVEQLKQQKEQLQDQLLTITIRTKTESVQEREEAISKIQQQTKVELQRIKKNSRENYERELRMVRESKQHAIDQCEKLTVQLNELRSDYDSLLVDHRSLQQSVEGQLSELRSQLKLKTFENERTSAMNVELSNNYNSCKQEVQMLSRKLDITKTAFYTLQAETGKRIAEIETRNESMERELQNYRTLEDELDKAVESNAPLFESVHGEGVNSSHNPGSSSLFVESGSCVSAVEAVTTFPTNATRRLKYSIYLARRISQLENHILELEATLKKRDENIEVLSEQLRRSNAKLEKTSHPYNYLVSTIEARDIEIEKKDRHIKSLEKDHRMAQRQIKQLTKDRHILQQDLESMLKQKASLSHLKDVLIKMQQGIKHRVLDD